MNKNTKSISWTKKTPAKVTKGKTTKSLATKTRATKTSAKVTKDKTTKSLATKTRATKTPTRVAKSKTMKAPATKTSAKVTKSRATKSLAVDKVSTTKIKEPPSLEDLPSNKSEDESEDESPEPSDRPLSDRSVRSGNSILDMAAMLKREAYLEKLRQYYHVNKETIHKDQNSKYPERREKAKNNPELVKQRQASKKYHHENKDKILPRIKKRYVEKVTKEKGLEVCPSCGKIKRPATKRCE